MLKSIALTLLLANVAAAHASGVEALQNFMRQTHSARAKFSQVVLDKNHKKLQEGGGTMQFSRPGKFRWDYDKPFDQLIVGDGVKLWIYDKDLNQVTTRKLDQIIGSSPAALLAGSNDIEKNFTLAELGQTGGLDWLEVTPRSQDATFEIIRMGFKDGMFETMELHDNFEQITVIRFLNLERNPKLAPELFQFVPPSGADVVGD